MHVLPKITAPCALLLLALLSAYCSWAAVAQDNAAAAGDPTASSNPPSSPTMTPGEVQLMPTLPLPTATANMTRPPSSSTAGNQQQQQQQQQQTGAAPVPAGRR